MPSLYTIVEKLGFKFHRLKTYLWYQFFLVKIGKNSTILKPIFITPGSITIGDNVFIAWSARIEGVTQHQSKYFNPKIIFNDGVTVQQNLHLTCAESVEIGKNTSIAANVTITDIHHPYDDINLPIEQQRIVVDPVCIGDDCKIYNNTIIMQGTKIGKHCTVGGNSVVSGTFGDYCVIVGAPAKIIKRYSFEKNEWLKTDAKGEFI